MDGLVEAGWATNKTVGSTGVSCERGTEQQWCRPWLPQSIYQDVGRKNFLYVLEVNCVIGYLQPRKICTNIENQ